MGYIYGIYLWIYLWDISMGYIYGIYLWLEYMEYLMGYDWSYNQQYDYDTEYGNTMEYSGI